MFKELRRKDRKLEDKEAYEILKNGEYGVLSTMGADGYAYGVPLNYVLHENALYFHCATEGSKLENIKLNDKVSFCVVSKAETVPEKFTTKFESVILFGKAFEVEGNEKEEAFAALLERFCSNHMEEGKKQIKEHMNRTKIIKISIEHYCGKIKK